MEADDWDFTKFPMYCATYYRVYGPDGSLVNVGKENEYGQFERAHDFTRFKQSIDVSSSFSLDDSFSSREFKKLRNMSLPISIRRESRHAVLSYEGETMNNLPYGKGRLTVITPTYTFYMEADDWDFTKFPMYCATYYRVYGPDGSLVNVAKDNEDGSFESAPDGLIASAEPRSIVVTDEERES
jgi:hypothetical protein